MQIMSKFSSVQFSASVACLYWHILWAAAPVTSLEVSGNLLQATVNLAVSGSQSVLRIQFSSMSLTNCCKGSVLASGFRLSKVAAIVSSGRKGSAITRLMEPFVSGLSYTQSEGLPLELFSKGPGSLPVPSSVNKKNPYVKNLVF